jgi:hypothetical protein
MYRRPPSFVDKSPNDSSVSVSTSDWSCRDSARTGRRAGTPGKCPAKPHVGQGNAHVVALDLPGAGPRDRPSRVDQVNARGGDWRADGPLPLGTHARRIHVCPRSATRKSASVHRAAMARTSACARTVWNPAISIRRIDPHWGHAVERLITLSCGRRRRPGERPAEWALGVTGAAA